MVMKKRLVPMCGMTATMSLVNISHVLAKAPAGEGAPDYSGVTGMYYTLIGLILAYGVYDSFLKKS
jgi:hypothetical protein